jgi:SNF2 family DNA or RNA helicase
LPALPDDGVLICSYDLAHVIPANFNFDLVIADEAHYLKSTDTKRTQSVLGKRGIIHRAKRFWALSGTPAPNHPGELWPLLFTFGVVKENYSDFITQYCTGYEFQNRFQITGAKVAKISELRERMKPIILRRRKEDVMKDLPKIHYQNWLVEPGLIDLETEFSFTQYIFPLDRTTELMEKLRREEQLVCAMIKTSKGNTKETETQALQSLAALSTSISTLRRYTGLQKVESIAEQIKDELERNEYQKIVIFAIHRDVIEGLRARLDKFKVVTLYGGTPPEKRQIHVDKFQKDSHTRVFIGNIQAAGTAITLTAAHQVVFAEQDWVPGNNAQAAMRCHRIGQTRPVTVRFAALADSIDERIAYALKKKTMELTKLFDQQRSGIEIFEENS